MYDYTYLSLILHREEPHHLIDVRLHSRCEDLTIGEVKIHVKID